MTPNKSMISKRGKLYLSEMDKALSESVTIMEMRMTAQNIVDTVEGAVAGLMASGESGPFLVTLPMEVSLLQAYEDYTSLEDRLLRVHNVKKVENRKQPGNAISVVAIKE